MAESELQPHLSPDSAYAGGTGHAHPSPREYVRIGAILGLLTAIEIAASYTIGGAPLIALLLTLAIVKFSIVVMWFMHLKFDDRRYARFFVAGVALAVTLFLIVLMLSRVFLR
ncbi:MAG: cytochrome C oxidase subunit IV family protein [Actinomycetota bacterium]